MKDRPNFKKPSDIVTKSSQPDNNGKDVWLDREVPIRETLSDRSESSSTLSLSSSEELIFPFENDASTPELRNMSKMTKALNEYREEKGNTTNPKGHEEKPKLNQSKGYYDKKKQSIKILNEYEKNLQADKAKKPKLVKSKGFYIK
jgi:hypothetical protein